MVKFSAVGTFSNGSTQNLTSQVSWASSATTVASISNVAGSQGIAMGLGQGQATISATLDGITGSTALNVSPAVLESLAVSPSAPFAVIGKTEQFTATGTFSDQTTQNLTSDVTWASSANAVATIAIAAGSQGLATGVARGTATISAALDGITGSTVLSVTPALQSITITPANPALPKGDSEQFTSTGVFDDNSTENLTNQVACASANTGAATISNGAGSNGSAFGLATGTSSITAAFDGITGSTVLTVSPAVLVSISVSPASPSIIENTTDQFSASGLYSDGSTQNLTGLVTWTSGTSSVAAISPDGLATGLAPGASTISAAYLGIAGAAPLSVSPPLVTLTHVDAIEKKHKVTKIVLTFSGALEADLASQKGVYTLVIAGKKGLFTAKNAMLVKVSKAQYNAASSPDTVTLTPKTAFALSKQVELTVKGLPPSGLKDALGRLIDGNQDGQPGSNAIAILSKTGVTIEA